MARRKRSKARKVVSNYKQQARLSAPRPIPSTQEILDASKQGTAVMFWLNAGEKTTKPNN